MSRATILILSFFLAPAVAAQDVRWDYVEEGPTGFQRFRHDDVRFINAREGWLVNQIGQIWHSNDSGESWQKQYDAAGRYAFRTVAATNDSTAFVGTIVTPDVVLFETRDGGESWSNISDRIEGPEVPAICGLWAASDRMVVGVGAYYGNPRIIRTLDGGRTWTSIDAKPLAETLVDVFFFDEQVGFATGGDSDVLEGNTVIIRTLDGGDSWERVYTGQKPDGVRGEWGWKFSFPSRQVGYLAVEYSNNDLDQLSKVLKTVDGGATWTELYIEGSRTYAGLQGIGFSDEQIGWASGRGITSMTEDGGQTWRQLLQYSMATPEGQLDGSVNRFEMVNDTLALAVGAYVHRLVGAPKPSTSSSPSAPPGRFSVAPAYSNPFGESGASIVLTLEMKAMVRVSVIDELGGRYGEVLSRTLEAGEHEITWDGRSEDGDRVPSGTYIFVIDIGDSREMKRMVEIR